MTTPQPTICRLCIAHCGILATVEGGKLTRVTGDPDNPLFKGYTCPKGRALPELHNHPERLLTSLKRRQGEDATILAGMIRVIIREGLFDRDFIAQQAEGFDSLAAQVEPFTPELVADRAGIDAAMLVEAATRPNGLLPSWQPRAQAFAPFQAWGFGEQMRVRGLGDSVAGMPMMGSVPVAVEPLG